MSPPPIRRGALLRAEFIQDMRCLDTLKPSVTCPKLGQIELEFSTYVELPRFAAGALAFLGRCEFFVRTRSASGCRARCEVCRCCSGASTPRFVRWHPPSIETMTHSDTQHFRPERSLLINEDNRGAGYDCAKVPQHSLLSDSSISHSSAFYAVDIQI